MAEFSPNKAGPQNTRELYYYVYTELQRLGGLLGDIDDLGGGGGGGTETDPVYSADPAATITQADIDSWDAAAAGGGGGGVKEPIQTITLTTAGEFDFGPALAGGVIPSGYKRLIIEGLVRSSEGAVASIIYALINEDDTSSNYRSQRFSTSGGSTAVTTSAAAPGVAVIAAGAAMTDLKSSIRLTVEGYSGSQPKVVSGDARGGRNTGVAELSFYSLVSLIADPVVRLRVRDDGHPTDGLIGKLTLYGEL